MFHLFRLLLYHLGLLLDQGSLVSAVGAEQQEEKGNCERKGEGLLYLAFPVPLFQVVEPAVENWGKKAEDLGLEFFLHSAQALGANICRKRFNYPDLFRFRSVFADSLLPHKPELVRK